MQMLQGAPEMEENMGGRYNLSMLIHILGFFVFGWQYVTVLTYYIGGACWEALALHPLSFALYLADFST